MTTSEYHALEASQLAKIGRRRLGPVEAAPCVNLGKESDLHAQILAECRRRGWIAFHGSMAHSTFRTPGEPDFVILTEGKFWLIECKTATGKLSIEQLGIAAWAAKLGHVVHVVRSFEEFMELIL